MLASRLDGADFLALVAALACIFAAMQARASASPVAAPALATPAQVTQVQQQRSGSFALLFGLSEPDPVPPSVGTRLRWSGAQGGNRLLVPVRITFKNLSNSYCRLATLSADLKNIAAVPLAQQVNFDDCKSAQTRYLDLNGDGALDVVQALDVNSNRYEATITVPIVYLSTAATESGYCYSEKISSQLEPIDLVSDTALLRKMDKLRMGAASMTGACDD